MEGKMKKSFLVAAMFLSGNAMAHVSGSGQVQHAGEHLLLAVVLVPLAWMVARKLFSR